MELGVNRSGVRLLFVGALETTRAVLLSRAEIAFHANSRRCRFPCAGGDGRGGRAGRRLLASV